jgi:hypothetical protein
MCDLLIKTFLNDHPVWSWELEKQLRALLDLLGLDLMRSVDLSPSRNHHRVLFSDASFHEIGGKGIAKCCILFASITSPAKRGLVFTIPEEILATFVERKTQIMMAELLAPAVAIREDPSFFKDNNFVAFQDNMSVLCTLVKGASRAPDACAVANAVHVRLAELAAAPWWEYIPSASNPADGGSRVGISCPISKAIGFDLKDIKCPALPSNFIETSPKAWGSFWRKKRASVWHQW